MAKRWTDLLGLFRAKSDDRLIWLRLRAPACAAAEAWRREVMDAPVIKELAGHFRVVEISRDEFPEIDATMQFVLQNLGERSGWPLQLFLDPKTAAPVFGCTSPDLAGCERILRHLLVAWDSDREALRAQGLASRALAHARDPQAGALPTQSAVEIQETLTGSTLARFLTPLHQSLIAETGRFGASEDAFLYPQAYACLLRRTETLRVGQAALERLARSESCDVLGGGFFRSTDASKLLTENAEMLELFDLGAKITRSPFVALAAEEARASLLRDYEGLEGAADFAAGLSEAAGYYDFSAADFLKALDAPERLPAQRFFGVARDDIWNFAAGAGVTTTFTRRPRLVTDIGTLATELSLPPADLQNQLAAVRRKLLAYRVSRPGLAPLRAPSTALATATALQALLAAGRLDDGAREEALLGRLASLVEDFKIRTRPSLAGLPLEAGDRLRWQLARACLAAASVKRKAGEQLEFERLWIARADQILGNVLDAEGGVRGVVAFLGERSDLADFTGRSSAALRVEAWLDRFEWARRRSEPAPLAQIGNALPAQIASYIEAAKDLGLMAAGLYGAFVRAGACGLFNPIRDITHPHIDA